MTPARREQAQLRDGIELREPGLRGMDGYVPAREQFTGNALGAARSAQHYEIGAEPVPPSWRQEPGRRNRHDIELQMTADCLDDGIAGRTDHSGSGTCLVETPPG